MPPKAAPKKSPKTSKSKTPARATKERPVVICTAKRGVFFGYTDQPSESIIERGVVTLKRCRMCVYWSIATRGVVGLAATGPAPDCKITLASPETTVNEITAVLGCSPGAASTWEAAPWK